MWISSLNDFLEEVPIQWLVCKFEVLPQTVKPISHNFFLAKHGIVTGSNSTGRLQQPKPRARECGKC